MFIEKGRDLLPKNITFKELHFVVVRFLSGRAIERIDDYTKDHPLSIIHN